MRIFLLLLMCLSWTAQANDFLNVNQAFIVESEAVDAQKLRFTWQIAPEYFLYKDKFQVHSRSKDVELGEPNLPMGEIKPDDFFGDLEIYRQQVQFEVPIIQNPAQLDQIRVEVIAQGCPPNAENCYPSYRQTLTITLPIETVETTELATKSAPIFNLDQIEAKPLSSIQSLFEDNTPFNTSGDDQFLDPEIAFQFSAELLDGKILAYWQLKKGYYLYRKSFDFQALNGVQLGTFELPDGEMKDDPTYGQTEVYYYSVVANIPIENTNGQDKVRLKASYQGCAEAGLCYPPTSKVVDIDLNTGAVSFIVEEDIEQDTESSSPAPASNNIKTQSEQDRIASLLSSNNMLYVILAFFGFGLLLSLTPCVFPMIPILSGIIVGQGDQVTTGRAFIMSLTYVLAMALTYTTFGVITGLIGQNLQLVFQNPYVLVSFALVFVALSLSMFGFYELQLPSFLQSKLTEASNKQKGGTLIGVSIMGVLSALIVGPCVAAPLAGALIYIGQTGDAVLGGLALFAMSMGMGVPLLLIGTSAGHLLPHSGAWMNNVKAVFGVLLLAVAIWMVERVFPAQVIMLLWATLFILSAVYMGIFDKLPVDVAWSGRLQKGLSIILFIYGVFLMIGAASGSNNPLKPLEKFAGSGSAVMSEQKGLVFQQIKGVEQLDQALASAKAQQKYVMLDFYADWCVSCKEMEHLTFTDKGVQDLLKDAVLLQADVTPNDAQDKALYKRFGIFGPPAIIFYHPDGRELNPYRVVGFMPADDFRQHLSQVHAS
ncbi:protein-disulfide reductase DsbD [Candidatus Albibeggiatoa sp. nov. NOAA]|uniref:protein-disulfide reductase DsbD n=1 Tax=Candidatus Albibeggiatoa sp. nov. NOAA TaxID=3162724 RepID=UPI0032F4BC4F|nr:protein-disulfide reductase DsbD [Thiotrichaceae bacterium]